MILDITCLHNLPSRLSYVSTLPDITQKPKHGIHELKNRFIDTWDRIPQGIIDEAIYQWAANRAACMCKCKRTSLRTPTGSGSRSAVMAAPALFRATSDTSTLVLFTAIHNIEGKAT